MMAIAYSTGDPPVVTELKVQPPRSLNQKKRLAKNMRSQGLSEAEIKRVVWHKDNSPTKKKGKEL